MEIILAIAIFAIVLPAILYTVGSMAGSEPRRNTLFDSLVVTEETKSIIQQIKSSDWSLIATNGEYNISGNESSYTLTPLVATPTPGVDGFTRVVRISDARRNNENLVETGGEVDPATKKITIEIGWENSRPTSTDLYVTRSDSIKSISTNTTEDLMDGASFAGTRITPYPTGTGGMITIDTTEPLPEVGLKSWWKMSGEYAVAQAEIDMAPLGVNNLRVMGNPTFGSGRFGNKVGLDSVSKYLVASSSASLEFSGQISSATWVKTTRTTGNMTILSKYSTTSNGYSLDIKDGVLGSSVGNGVNIITATKTDSVVTDGLWHHVGMVYDGSTLRVWVDGSPGEATSGIGLLSPNTSPLFIGRNPTSETSNFVGDVDDIQIYGTALTDIEMRNLLYSSYTSKIHPIKGGLVHSLSAVLSQPPNTQAFLQIAIANPVDKNCDAAQYVFVGPDKTTQTYFGMGSVGDSTLSSIVPASPSGTYYNPGLCLRWRALLLSKNDYSQEKPTVSNVRFTYSP